jgi:hypothetical protein
VANASQAQYQLFGKAQLEVFGEASFGWSYWTVRCNSVHWDYEWNLRNRYLIIGKQFVLQNLLSSYKWSYMTINFVRLHVIILLSAHAYVMYHVPLNSFISQLVLMSDDHEKCLMNLVTLLELRMRVG